MTHTHTHTHTCMHTHTAVLTSSDEISNHSPKKEILQLDLSLLLANASTHPSQKYVQAVASSNDGSWLRLWDLALEIGVFGTTCVQAILRFLSLHAHSDGTCPAPSCSFNVGFESPCENFLSAHTSLDISLDNFIHACTNFSFHYSLMVMVFIAVLNLYGITNFISHVFFAFSNSSCKTKVIIFSLTRTHTDTHTHTRTHRHTHTHTHAHAHTRTPLPPHTQTHAKHLQNRESAGFDLFDDRVRAENRVRLDDGESSLNRHQRRAGKERHVQIVHRCYQY